MAVAAGLYHHVVPPRPRPDYQSVDEAARLVGLSSATIWRYLEKGHLTRHYTTVGRRQTRVDLNELRALVKNPPVEPAEPTE